MEQKLKDQKVEAQYALPISVSWESVKLGFKVSLLLSIIYAVIGVFIFMITEVDVKSLPFVLMWGSLLIAILAIFPSILIGSLTGAIVGLIAETSFAKQISRMGFSFVGMIVCAVIAISVHILFGIKIILSFEPSSNYSTGIFETYPFLFGIPTLIYILAGGWFGWNVYSKFIIS